MGYPCYKIKNEEEYNYIKQCLKIFGYDTGTMDPYKKFYNLIVLNSDGRFGIVDNVPFHFNDRFSRYLVNTIDKFLSTAAKLKNVPFKPRKDNSKMNMENNKSQIKEPKVGDKVLVKNNRDEYFQTRIYIGKIHNKNACVNAGYEDEFDQNKPVVLSFWDEMITELKVTKAQIAKKFGVPVNMLEIVD